MRATIISHGNAPPILEAAEQALNEIATFVKLGVVNDGLFAAAATGNTGRDVALAERSAPSVAVIALVGNQDLGLRERGKHHINPPIIADLTFGQQQDDRSPVTVGDGVELGVESASGPSDAPRKSPFFSRLAAVR